MARKFINKENTNEELVSVSKSLLKASKDLTQNFDFSIFTDALDDFDAIYTKYNLDSAKIQYIHRLFEYQSIPQCIDEINKEMDELFLKDKFQALSIVVQYLSFFQNDWDKILSYYQNDTLNFIYTFLSSYYQVIINKIDNPELKTNLYFNLDIYVLKRELEQQQQHHHPYLDFFMKKITNILNVPYQKNTLTLLKSFFVNGKAIKEPYTSNILTPINNVQEIAIN